MHRLILLIQLASLNAAYAACPTTAQEWLQARDESAKKIVADSLKSTAGSAVFASANVSGMAKLLSDCLTDAQPLFQDSQDLQAGMQNIIRFTEARKNEGRPGWQLGFNVPDAQYFAETADWTAVPDDLKTQPILRAFSDPQTVAHGLELLEQLNATYPEERKMIFFQYRSQHLTTPDASRVFGRIFVYYPGNPEKWIQYGVPEQGLPRTQNLSVVSIKTEPDGRQNVYFKDHFRMYDKEEIYLKDRFAVNGQSDNCTSCHKSGILPIFPAPGSFSIADGEKIAAVNAIFRKYKPAAFGGYLNPDHLGPGLGMTAKKIVDARTDEFLSQCTQGLQLPDQATSFTKIRRAMNCSGCHNNQRFGDLNFPVNRSLVRSYVTAGLMPPVSGASLTSPEREGLIRCLEDEYFGRSEGSSKILLQWLTGAL